MEGEIFLWFVWEVTVKVKIRAERVKRVASRRRMKRRRRRRVGVLYSPLLSLIFDRKLDGEGEILFLFYI